MYYRWSGGVRIGDSCSLSMYSIVYSASHYADSPTFEYYSRSTTLEDCVWLGARSIVLPGSYLRDYTILSANSVYKGESDKNDILCGNPATTQMRKRKITEKYIQYNSNYFK